MESADEVFERLCGPPPYCDEVTTRQMGRGKTWRYFKLVDESSFKESWFNNGEYNLYVDIFPGVVGRSVSSSLMFDVCSKVDGVRIRGGDVDCDVLYDFENLKFLSVSDLRGKLDLSHFGGLHYLSASNIFLENIGSCSSLRVLILSGNTGMDKDCVQLEGVRGLKVLHLHRTKTGSIRGIDNLQLEELDISYQPQGFDVGGMSGSFDTLRFFEADSCKNIKNLKFISFMTSIECVFLKNIGNIDSLYIFENAIKRGCDVRILDSIVLDGVVDVYRRRGLIIEPFKKFYK